MNSMDESKNSVDISMNSKNESKRKKNTAGHNEVKHVESTPMDASRGGTLHKKKEAGLHKTKVDKLHKLNKTELHKPKETELRKRDALRLSNEESNHLTRDCIRTALLYLMAENSYEKISVTQIINRSGVSRAGFYRNYKSKDDVLYELREQQYKDLKKMLSFEHLDKDPVARFTEAFRWIQNHPDHIRLMMKAQQPLPMKTNQRPGEVFYDSSLPTRDRYRKVVFETAIPFIILIWSEGGMKESPEEMGRICGELYQELMHK